MLNPKPPTHIKLEEERPRSQTQTHTHTHTHTQVEKLRPHGMDEAMGTKKGSPFAKGSDSDEAHLIILGVNANPLAPPATNAYLPLLGYQDFWCH